MRVLCHLRTGPVIFSHYVRIFLWYGWFVRIRKAICDRQYDGSANSRHRVGQPGNWRRYRSTLDAILRLLQGCINAGDSRWPGPLRVMERARLMPRWWRCIVVSNRKLWHTWVIPQYQVRSQASRGPCQEAPTQNVAKPTMPSRRICVSLVNAANGNLGYVPPIGEKLLKDWSAAPDSEWSAIRRLATKRASKNISPVKSACVNGGTKLLMTGKPEINFPMADHSPTTVRIRCHVLCKL